MTEHDGSTGLAPHYSHEQALRFPLGVDSHDTGLRYLFDFTVAARALELRPGARVLDFASGSGFLSELLNRLGYRTVAIDIDATTLCHARERVALDPRNAPERARFVCADGQRLPFANDTFDGVLCLNALHHMPDYRATLAEMLRVLRPGGRASFSEPGSLHSQSPESVAVKQQFGVIERDVVLDEVQALARETGFARMVLKPYLYPELVELDYRDFASLRAGCPPPASRLDGATVAEIVEKSHSHFCLVKAGAAAITSASAAPDLLRARLRTPPLPARASAGGRLATTVECVNTGEATWLATKRDVGGYVTLGVRIHRADGRLVDDLRGRRPLPHDVRPGESVRIDTELSLDGLPPGLYRLVFDMVNERVAWFRDIGSPVSEHEIRID